MSYKSNDKWSVFLGDYTEYTPTFQEMKEQLEKYIKYDTMITKAINQFCEEEYEITKVKITIKKKKK